MCKVLLILTALFSLFGCASPYAPTGSGMTVSQARHTLESLLPGKWAYHAGSTAHPKLISELRLRRDGIGLLWTKSREVSDGLLSGHYVFDSPKTFKVCYFDLMTPTASYEYVNGICDVRFFIGTSAEARTVADALYVLKQNSK